MPPPIVTLIVMARRRARPFLRRLRPVSGIVWCAQTCREVRLILREHPEVQVLLTDDALPDGDWRSILKEARQTQASPEVVVCTRQPHKSFSCEVIQNGAYDVLVEPLEATQVTEAVRAAAARNSIRRMAARVPARSRTA